MSELSQDVAAKLLMEACMKIRVLSKIRRRLSAFSLTEALFGVGIMSTVFISLYTGMATGFQSIRDSQENLRATQILLEKFETLRLYNWDQITAPGFIPPTFTTTYAPTEGSQGITYTGRVLIQQPPSTEVYHADLRAVTIVLTWTSNRVPHTRLFTSYVAKYGIQNYIY